MTQISLPPNPEMRKRHSALMPIMKYLFHLHYQEAPYRGTYYETLLTDLENATKVLKILFDPRYTTSVSLYKAMGNTKPWNTKHACIYANEAVLAGDEMVYRGCYLAEIKNLNFDDFYTRHPALSPGKKDFRLWVRLLDLRNLKREEYKESYRRWVQRSRLGKKFEEMRQIRTYALQGRLIDLGEKGRRVIISKTWFPKPPCNKEEHTKE